MKTAQSELWELLQSLDQGEKRYCKVYLQGFTKAGEKHARLFDVLVRMSRYDEVKLYKRLKADFPKKPQLATAKHFLLEQVCRALGAYHRASNPVYQARELISRGEILLQKGRLNLGIQQLEKAIDLALEHQLWEVLLEAYRIKLVRLVNAGSREALAADYTHILAQSDLVLQDLQIGQETYGQFFQFYARLGSRKTPTPDQIPDLEESFWLDRMESAHRFRDKANIANLAYWIFNAFHQPEQAHRFLLALLDLYEAEPVWKHRQFSAYSSQLYTAAIWYFQKEDFEKMQTLVDLLDDLEMDLQGTSDRSNLELLHLRKENLRRMWVCFSGEAQRLQGAWEIYGGRLNRKKDLEQLFLFAIRSMDVCILFQAREYPATMRLIQDTLSHYPPGFNKIGQLMLRLVGILTSYVTGDLDLLDREIENLQYNLKAHPAEQAFLLPYIHLVRQMSNSTQPESVLSHFQQQPYTGPALNAHQQTTKLILDRLLCFLLP